MDAQDVQQWIEGYIRAWNTNDPALIGGLFGADAAYLTGPFDAPWQGREKIVQNWLARKDEPGSFRFRYEILTACDDLGVVRGWTEYLQPPREFSNIWVIRFNAHGLCREFTEWWIQR